MDDNLNSIVLRAAIQRPLYKLLDYQCDLHTLPELGYRIRVPLGNTVVTAIVVEVNVESSYKNLKSVLEILDDKPVFSPSMWSLLSWASKYYCYPLGEVLFHALPVTLRKGKPFPKVVFWQASKIGHDQLNDVLKRAPKQQDMLRALKKSEISSQQLLEQFGNNWRNILRQLDQKKFIVKKEKNFDYIHKKIQPDVLIKKSLTLTSEQQDCVKKISDYFKESSPKPVLLHGITGSGKTEVYLRAVESILDDKKQVLVLVPEIGLTPQLLSRFKEHFRQKNIASLHSSLPDTERLKAWMGARSGAVDVIIGTRSAVFTPMKDLGAIIVDEEHDGSFKQQEGFLYQGRDMAIKRAFDTRIPILLGSATPSLESLYNVEHQGYRYLKLGSRPGKSRPPEIVLQDIRTLSLEAGISSLMMEEIQQHLNQDKQVMLFLNRRGFAPVLMCQGCGWHACCQYCDVGMTYHAAAHKVVCHHCGQQQAVTPICPDCGSKRVTTQGQGTERIESTLNTHFPNTSVIRIDRDSTSKKGSLESKLKKVSLGEPVILIGTQMLAKGHDFPNLTLVGILDVDQALFSMDYRAHERFAQQILQVAGRAGRGEDLGRVILQTSQPQHPLILGLLSQGYHETAIKILNERKAWSYPPFATQALIRVSASSSEMGMNFLQLLRQDLDKIADNNVIILGPMASPLFKKANRYRFQLLLSSAKRGVLHKALNDALFLLVKSKRVGGVRWVIDVDPLDFL